MTDLPIVCTLGPAAVKARREDLLANLVRCVEERYETSNGYRFRFAAADEILVNIARTIDVERQCCRFLQFRLTIEPDGGPIWLDVTGPPGSREFVAALIES